MNNTVVAKWLLLLCLLATRSSAAAPLLDLVNLRCVQWAVTGPCYCNPYTPCVQVEYWEPGWLVETVKRPGTTSLDLAAPLLQAVFDAVGVPPFGGGGRRQCDGHGAYQSPVQ